VLWFSCTVAPIHIFGNVLLSLTFHRFTLSGFFDGTPPNPNIDFNFLNTNLICKGAIPPGAALTQMQQIERVAIEAKRMGIDIMPIIIR